MTHGLPGSAHLSSRRWSGFVSKKLKCCLDTAAHLGIELAKLARGGRRKFDAIGHVRPRSALTCSQGIGNTYAQEIGPLAVEVLRAVKNTLDPVGILNPGVLIS